MGGRGERVLLVLCLVMECKQRSFSAAQRKTLLNTEEEENTALPVEQLCRLTPDNRGQRSTGPARLASEDEEVLSAEGK